MRKLILILFLIIIPNITYSQFIINDYLKSVRLVFVPGLTADQPIVTINQNHLFVCNKEIETDSLNNAVFRLYDVDKKEHFQLSVNINVSKLFVEALDRIPVDDFIVDSDRIFILAFKNLLIFSKHENTYKLLRCIEFDNSYSNMTLVKDKLFLYDASAAKPYYYSRCTLNLIDFSKSEAQFYRPAGYEFLHFGPRQPMCISNNFLAYSDITKYNIYIENFASGVVDTIRGKFDDKYANKDDTLKYLETESDKIMNAKNKIDYLRPYLMKLNFMHQIFLFNNYLVVRKSIPPLHPSLDDLYHFKYDIYEYKNSKWKLVHGDLEGMKADRSKSLEEAKTYLSESAYQVGNTLVDFFPIPFELTMEDFNIPVSELLKKIEQATLDDKEGFYINLLELKINK